MLVSPYLNDEARPKLPDEPHRRCRVNSNALTGGSAINGYTYQDVRDHCASQRQDKQKARLPYRLRCSRLNSGDRFRARSRYFTDSGIIGSKIFVNRLWQQLKTDDDNPHRVPIRITGLDDLFSLKRLSENIL